MHLFDRLFDWLPKLIVIGIIFIITILVSYLFNKYYKRFIRHSTTILRNDPTNYRFIGHAITAVIYLLGICLMLLYVNVLSTVSKFLLAGAGILTVAVGFASQNAFSNIISGIFIIIFKPFRVNDRLKIRENLNGSVEDITLRHTIIKDVENRRIIIPNAVIQQEIITNSDFSDIRVCKLVDFKLAVNTDIDKVRSIMKEAILNHPNFIDHRSPKQKADEAELAPVKVINIIDNMIVVRGSGWAADTGKGYDMLCDLYESIIKAFNKEGIALSNQNEVLVKMDKPAEPDPDSNE